MAHHFNTIQDQAELEQPQNVGKDIRIVNRGTALFPLIIEGHHPHIQICGESYVNVYGSMEIYAQGQSVVRAYDRCTVSAKGSARVYLFDDTAAALSDRSVAHAYDRADVSGYDHSRIIIHTGEDGRSFHGRTAVRDYSTKEHQE